jgi:hypothetical protein
MAHKQSAHTAHPARLTHLTHSPRAQIASIKSGLLIECDDHSDKAHKASLNHAWSVLGANDGKEQIALYQTAGE